MKVPSLKLINGSFATLLLLLALAGGGLGLNYDRIGLVSRQGIEDKSTGLDNPLPKSMEELATDADLIVTGTIMSIADQGTFYGYDKGAAHRKNLDKTSPTPLGLPYVDYQIEVDQVIRGQIEPSRPTLLRVLGNPEVSRSLATPRIGDKRLFFLRMSPDRKTYGVPSLLHQIDIEGPVAVYYKGSSALLPFGKTFHPRDFTARIEEVVANLQSMPH